MTRSAGREGEREDDRAGRVDRKGRNDRVGSYGRTDSYGKVCRWRRLPGSEGCLVGAEEISGAELWSGVQSSVLRFVWLVEWSAVGLAERSLRSEDGRAADTAGMGGHFCNLNSP